MTAKKIFDSPFEKTFDYKDYEIDYTMYLYRIDDGIFVSPYTYDFSLKSLRKKCFNVNPDDLFTVYDDFTYSKYYFIVDNNAITKESIKKYIPVPSKILPMKIFDSHDWIEDHSDKILNIIFKIEIDENFKAVLKQKIHDSDDFLKVINSPDYKTTCSDSECVEEIRKSIIKNLKI